MPPKNAQNDNSRPLKIRVTHAKLTLNWNFSEIHPKIHPKIHP
jgi:hypothetical protein